MHSNFYLSPLAACLAFSMMSPVQAAEPIPLNKSSLPALQQQFHLNMPGVKQAKGSVTDSLQFIKQHTDKNNISHIRMQQQYAGFPVVGGYAILHSPQAAQTFLAARNQADIKMNGVVYHGLQKELGQPSADFIKNGSLALQQFKSQFANHSVSEETVTPLVYIDENHNAHWAYKVSVFVTYQDKIPERPTAIVDAVTYKPFVQWNNVKTQVSPAKGQGYGGNSKVGKFTYGTGLPLLELTRDDAASKCFMENTGVRVVDMEHRYSSKNNPMSFSCKVADKATDAFWTGYQSDGYDKENGAFSPTNDALYAGYVINHMYKDWYNINALSKSDGSPMQLVMRVHYGDGYENAYWDGRQMTFGDGEDMMYPLVSLGVGAHEISHGFTEQHSDLQYYGQSGGMNEAFSDMAAQAAEFYSIGKASWQIGGEIMKESSGYDALRFMDLPSRDGMSIDTADEYYGGLDVHYSSGVFNRLYYLIANLPGWDARKAFDIMVKANIDYWTPYSTFDEGGCGVLSAAKDLGFDLNGVKQSLATVTIDYESCN
ncbi:zinc metalloprotease [Legionella beliardensis]|uniref:Neutral metalloproteinase n=2 Tax=Legionella beliardensis TaxID=91822 RepID=A0A378HZT7_9GAMM|nr:M4 family metallopeptidase [Legionella beliardensis]STX28021.1 zinc metalloprotease [Legionella beliardensis]